MRGCGDQRQLRVKLAFHASPDRKPLSGPTGKSFASFDDASRPRRAAVRHIQIGRGHPSITRRFSGCWRFTRARCCARSPCRKTRCSANTSSVSDRPRRCAQAPPAPIASEAIARVPGKFLREQTTAGPVPATLARSSSDPRVPQLAMLDALIRSAVCAVVQCRVSKAAAFLSASRAVAQRLRPRAKPRSAQTGSRAQRRLKSRRASFLAAAHRHGGARGK